MVGSPCLKQYKYTYYYRLYRWPGHLHYKLFPRPIPLLLLAQFQLGLLYL
jgi:hypothetical protein